MTSQPHSVTQAQRFENLVAAGGREGFIGGRSYAITITDTSSWSGTAVTGGARLS